MDTLQTDSVSLSALMPNLAPWLNTGEPVQDAPRSPCDTCGARRLCQAVQLGCDDAQRPVAFHMSTRKVRAGEAVYRVGDRLHNLYVSRAGSCKSIRLHRDGRQQITGFHLGGDFLGLDAIATGRHQTEALALEDMVVCMLPYDEIEALADGSSKVRRGLERMLSAEIAREGSLLMAIGQLNAEERVAAFLIDLSERYAARGFSPASFNLRMSREEIGSHLGMKLETVSRMLSRFQQRRLIALQGRRVQILDLPALQLI